LLKALGESGVALCSRLAGPVGLEIGADSPESIALSVLAEVHAVLKGATRPASAS
jgi:xanthine/CO dehydrogenase XdhC/CoxF family maturation factor